MGDILGMEVLFIFASILLVVVLVKCIYNTMERSESEEPSAPTLEDTLISLLGYFKGHIHKFAIYPDKMIIYCFKNSSKDDVTDFNEIKIRYCDIGFKTVSEDDCTQLRENVNSAMDSN